MKEIRIFFRNRTVSVTVIFMIILEITVIIKSVNVIPDGSVSPFFSFSFFQKHLILMFFPCLLINILIMAFSVTAERQNGMLSKLLPYGESLMVRNKTAAATVISLFFSVLYVISAVIASGLKTYLSFKFAVFLTASYIFVFYALSSFSVSFAFMYYHGDNDYGPELKQMLIYIFIVSAAVSSFYYFISENMIYFYEFITGYRRVYPNAEFILFMVLTFIFMTGARIMLKKAEKKLYEEQY